MFKYNNSDFSGGNGGEVLSGLDLRCRVMRCGAVWCAVLCCGVLFMEVVNPKK